MRQAQEANSCCTARNRIFVSFCHPRDSNVNNHQSQAESFTQLFTLVLSVPGTSAGVFSLWPDTLQGKTFCPLLSVCVNNQSYLGGAGRRCSLGMCAALSDP